MRPDLTDDQLGGLIRALAEFRTQLPGWWWSFGTCSVSNDFSCAPDRCGPDADLLALRAFDNGFHGDFDAEPCEAVASVMAEALEARAAVRLLPATKGDAA